jgi:hypothetical protein
LTREEISCYTGLAQLYFGSIQIPDDVMASIEDPYVSDDENHLCNEEIESIIAQMDETMTA